MTGGFSRKNRPTNGPITIPSVLITVAESYGEMLGAGEILPETCRSALARIAMHHRGVNDADFDESLEELCNVAYRVAYTPALEAQRDIEAGIRNLLDKRAPRAVIFKRACQLAEARLLQPDVRVIVDRAIAAYMANRGRQ